MATDLRKNQRALRDAGSTEGRLGASGSRWPYVATAIVLVIVTALTVIVLSGTSRPAVSPEQPEYVTFVPTVPAHFPGPDSYAESESSGRHTIADLQVTLRDS